MAASIGSITVKLKLDSEEFERDARALVQTPSIGRTVHYHVKGAPGGEYPGGEYYPEPRAAIITAVHDSDEDGNPFVSLCVLNPTGMFFPGEVPFTAEPASGCWSWPPRA
ncbi:hypothetical protein [Cryobacterium aureum]|uniref:hypothetical protein n=1 Tax=Cryobacterium aureum TaxID=995037 RepID=UPI00196A4432|nr:hypothetical protein [Cryobacterium aureum]